MISINNSYQKVVEEWQEIGGVLGNDIERNGEVFIYIMDDGEFEDRWKVQSEHHFPVNDEITKEDFARFLCRVALEYVGYSKKEIEKLINW